MRTRIKMCGTTRIEDALAAVSFGVDALGFIFVEKSPRKITPAAADSIISSLPSFVGRVGVFVDSDLDEIKSIVERCGLTQLQLHGNESVSFCSQLKCWNKTLSICKAFRVGADCPSVDTASYTASVDSILLDTYIKGVAGGTGDCFDWRLIDTLDVERPLILAGGLTPDNIRQALVKVSPFAVDVNSGVEDAPGIKNHKKLSELVALVGDYDYQRRQQSV